MGIGDEAEHDVWFSSWQLSPPSLASLLLLLLLVHASPACVVLLHRCETCGSTDVRRGTQCGGHVALVAELLWGEKEGLLIKGICHYLLLLLFLFSYLREKRLFGYGP